MTITLDSPRAPVVEATQHLRITITDPHGRPIDGAEVYVDLDMDMLCLSGAAPGAEPLGAGQYEALAVYLMPGDWQVSVIARIAEKERMMCRSAALTLVMIAALAACSSAASPLAVPSATTLAPTTSEAAPTSVTSAPRLSVPPRPRRPARRAPL